LGWHVETWHPEFDDKKEVFSFGAIPRREIKTYLTDDFWKAFLLWRNYCRYGLPSGKGWAAEPAAIIDLFNLFDDAKDILDTQSRADIERRKAKGNNADH